MENLEDMNLPCPEDAATYDATRGATRGATHVATRRRSENDW
jgi:hypothetical protein